MPLPVLASPVPDPPQGEAGRVDLLALLPCPLKVPFDSLLQEFAAGRPELRLWVEGNANHEGDLLRRLSLSASLDGVADAILSPGLNALFHEPFRSRFIDTGEMVCIGAGDESARFRSLGLHDGEGRYAMLAMNLLVMAIDEAALAGRPAPRAISDLLDSIFEGSIAIRGNRDRSFCETLLLAIHARHGDLGIEALARSTRHGWHPSQMVKAIGSGSPDAPAVSVLPRFFATALSGRKGVRIVWPEDGAVVSPITLLVKAARRRALEELMAFLSGPEVGQVFSGALFPSLRSDVPAGVPEHAPLDWIGWELVRAQDVATRLDRLNAIFRRRRAEQP